MSAEPAIYRTTASGASAKSREELLEALRAIAIRQFAREARNHTLQPTAIVNEAWIRIASQSDGTPEGEAAFRQWAGRIVREVLIDHARRRLAAKRDVRRRAALEDVHLIEVGLAPEELLAISESLEELAATHPRMAAVVEMRYFGGMKDADIAARLGVTDRTVRADWAAARAWLYGRMTAEPG